MSSITKSKISGDKLSFIDPEIAEIIEKEKLRQHSSIELIASENFVSKAVLEAQGSVLTNKYAEGYSGRRYYNGCDEVDKAENLAIKRVKELFKCNYANVQPHSGTQANLSSMFAILKPGDTILGMSLNSGGHLTHGAAPTTSGKWFNAIPYDVNPKTYLIDYDHIENLAEKHQPKLIIAGYSCYSRHIEFAKFRAIADKVGAYLLADIAHIAGLVATGFHQSPFPHAHIVTSTTHKTLRGPRGGIILSNNEELANLINKAVFPGSQGGPLMHVIAAKAVCFKEALQEDFVQYIKQVVANAKILSETLQRRGYDILSGGTDNHIVVLDLRNKSITGKLAAENLDYCLITANKNAIPFDSASPFITSGVRLGTPACTSRGFKEKEFEYVGNIIADVLDILVNDQKLSAEFIQKTKNKVNDLTNQFPIY